jgi:hypothetical protein
MSMENSGGMISTGETPDLSTTALWQSYQQSHILANKEELGEGNYEFGLTEYLCSYLVIFYML